MWGADLAETASGEDTGAAEAPLRFHFPAAASVRGGLLVFLFKRKDPDKEYVEGQAKRSDGHDSWKHFLCENQATKARLQVGHWGGEGTLGREEHGWGRDSSFYTVWTKHRLSKNALLDNPETLKTNPETTMSSPASPKWGLCGTHRVEVQRKPLLVVKTNTTSNGPNIIRNSKKRCSEKEINTLFVVSAKTA